MPVLTPPPLPTPGMGFPHGEPVVVLEPGSITDPYSTETREDWSDPAVTTTNVDGVGVEPRPSSEPVQDARNATVSGFTLYMPTGTPITARSRVVVRGATYRVLGEPAEWRNPFTGWTPGLVVQTERMVG